MLVTGQAVIDVPKQMSSLLEAVATRKDKAAFAALFQHFAPRVKSYLIRLGSDEGRAEELSQEVLVTVWRKAELFDPRKSAASTWIFAIARNARIDLLRREKRPEYEVDDPTLVVDPDPLADEVMSQGQREQLVRNAMTLLPADQAQVLRLSFFEDKPHSIIAEELELPLGTVKSRLRLAMKRLRYALGEEV